MKVSAVDIRAYTYNPAAEEEPALPAVPKPPGEDNDVAAILERSRKDAEDAVKSKASGPTDHSGRLTRQLVAAQFQSEVYSIITEAHKNLADWLRAAAGGDGKAMAVIKRLNKLIRRASRKVGDLNKEDLVRQKRQRAERKEQENIAQQLRAELRRKTEERKKREKGYLRDEQRIGTIQPHFPKPMSPAELEAKILALSAAMDQAASFAGAEPAGVAGLDGGETAAAETGAPAAE